jgi:hypothetical protein
MYVCLCTGVCAAGKWPTLSLPAHRRPSRSVNSPGQARYAGAAGTIRAIIAATLQEQTCEAADRGIDQPPLMPR